MGSNWMLPIRLFVIIFNPVTVLCLGAAALNFYNWAYFDFLVYDQQLHLVCGAVSVSFLFLALYCKRKCVTIFVIILMGILVAVEAAAAISLTMVRRQDVFVVLSGNVEKSFSDAYNPSIDSNPATRNKWDHIQYYGKCCGLNNYTDYSHMPVDNRWRKFVAIPVPEVCLECNSRVNRSCDVSYPEDLYQEGCGDLIRHHIVDMIEESMLGMIPICALQILWIVAACYICGLCRCCVRSSIKYQPLGKQKTVFTIG